MRSDDTYLVLARRVKDQLHSIVRRIGLKIGRGRPDITTGVLDSFDDSRKILHIGAGATEQNQRDGVSLWRCWLRNSQRARSSISGRARADLQSR